MVSAFALLSMTWLLPFILKNKKLYFIVMYTAMALVIGLRDISVGSDTANYTYIFTAFSDSPDFSPVYYLELGIRILVWLGVSLTGEVWGAFLFCAILTYAFLGYFIYRITNDRYYWLATFLVIALGFFFFSANGLRQAVAVPIIACSIFPLAKKQYFKAGLIILAAWLFHYTAIAFLTLIPLVKLYHFLKKGNASLLLCVCIPAMLFLIVLFVGYSLIITNSDLLGGFSYYLTAASGEDGQAVSLGAVRWASLFCYMLIIICVLIFHQDCKENIVGIAALFLLLAVVFTVGQEMWMFVLRRIVDYFIIYACFLIPFFVKMFRSVEVKTILIVLIILGGYLSVWHMLATGINGYV
ncbi:EpsG family protein [uncultured Selenomonas sp.]|uniref:EpsG family protein n=1 Tax=uncultured Selenomonas sp. TaxID=159275 RepID=UPI0028D8C3BD|nr:EpsG family protein [uncultured Selenomonas sp.]